MSCLISFYTPRLIHKWRKGHVFLEDCFLFLDHAWDDFRDGRRVRFVDETERDRDQQMRHCLAIFRAKQMIKITDTLMTKPAPQGKMVSESIPGRGKAVQGLKSSGRHLIGPDRRRRGSGRPKGEAWRKWSWRWRREQSHVGPLNPGRGSFLKWLGSHWGFLRWGIRAIWLPFFKDHSGLWWHTFQYFPFIVLPLNI